MRGQALKKLIRPTSVVEEGLKMSINKSPLLIERKISFSPLPAPVKMRNLKGTGISEELLSCSSRKLPEEEYCKLNSNYMKLENMTEIQP